MRVAANHDFAGSNPALCSNSGGPKVDTFTDYHLADCPTEHARLEFILKRDGHDEAFAFAERTMKAYRHIALEGLRLPKQGRGRGCPKQMREGFIRSYLDLKRFYLTKGGFE